MGELGVGYVFLKQRRSIPREHRTEELQLRCIVARHQMEEYKRPGVVVGIATEWPEEGGGFSLDLSLFDVQTWTEEHRARAENIRDELGYFKSPRIRHVSGDEFP